MDYEVKDIRADIIEASQNVPVILDFWAEWCGPCRALGPVLEKLAQTAGNRWKLVKVDVENPQNQPLAGQFQIRSIPAVRMIYQGKLLGQFDGALPEAEVKKWLKTHLPEGEGGEEESEETSALVAALQSGNRERALKIARDAYNAENQNEEKKVQLAMLLLPDDAETAKKLLDSVGVEGKYEIEKEVVQTTNHMKKIADGEAVPEAKKPELLEKYKNACQAVFEGDYDAAAAGFIDVIMLDRSLDDDGARKACVALFKMLSENHPVTQNYKRRFSMALY